MQLLIFGSSSELLRMARARWNPTHGDADFGRGQRDRPVIPVRLSTRGARLPAILTVDDDVPSLPWPLAN